MLRVPPWVTAPARPPAAAAGARRGAARPRRAGGDDDGAEDGDGADRCGRGRRFMVVVPFGWCRWMSVGGRGRGGRCRGRRAGRRAARPARPSHGRAAGRPGRSTTWRTVAPSPPGSAPSRITRSASWSASSTSWVTSRTVVGAAAWTSRSRSCIRSRVRASSAPNGSSSRSTHGSRASARASDVRWAMPPETSRGRWPAKSVSPTRSSSSATRVAPVRDRRSRAAGRAPRSPASVRHGSSRGSWKATAQRGSMPATGVAVDPDRAGRRRVQPGGDPQQRGLAAAARARGSRRPRPAARSARCPAGRRGVEPVVNAASRGVARTRGPGRRTRRRAGHRSRPGGRDLRPAGSNGDGSMDTGVVPRSVDGWMSVPADRGRRRTTGCPGHRKAAVLIWTAAPGPALGPVVIGRMTCDLAPCVPSMGPPGHTHVDMSVVGRHASDYMGRTRRMSTALVGFLDCDSVVDRGPPAVGGPVECPS